MKLDPNTIAANLNAAAAAEAEAAAADPQSVQASSSGGIAGTASSANNSSQLTGSGLLKDHSPRDAQVIQAILKELNIDKYEKRVVPQLLDFSYRYIQNILEEADLLSQYAKKKTIDADDVHCALNMRSNRSFVGPPSRDKVIEIARSRNSIPLPIIRTHNGMRLPVDRYSLVSANVTLNPKTKPLE